MDLFTLPLLRVNTQIPRLQAPVFGAFTPQTLGKNTPKQKALLNPLTPRRIQLCEDRTQEAGERKLKEAAMGISNDAESNGER